MLGDIIQLACSTCNFVWTRLDICPTLPVHDCSKFQGKNQLPKPLATLILEYLRDHPASKFDDVCIGLKKTCEGGKLKVNDWIAAGVQNGMIERAGERFSLTELGRRVLDETVKV